MVKVIKRDESVVEFDKSKIYNAISKANKETDEMLESDIEGVVDKVINDILPGDNLIDVESIQDIVESELMLNKHTKTAKAYILYRDKRNQDRKSSVFEYRKNLKPYEYPELEKYKEAIQHSYWLHTEFNYTADIHEFHKSVTPAEQNAIKNAMLAISQVEVDVKTFWARLYDHLPKPEFANVGATFSESEVRHSDAYSHLLELLGLNHEFEKIDEIPALNQRVEYLKTYLKYANTGDKRDYTLAILLFSLFIEHVSLFSQFLIIMAFNKHENKFKGISNVIEATSKEENLHGFFGIDLILQIKEENPKWFDESMERRVYDLAKQSYKSEKEVLDWIFEKGELDFLPQYTVEEFVKHRLNNSLESIGYERIFDVDEDEVEKTEWFDEEVAMTKHNDFFQKRSVNYSKRMTSMTADDLF